jgi:hypothetical protein
MFFSRQLPLALLLGSATLGLVPANADAQVVGPRYDACLTLDADGKPFPNPNASFICNQIEFERQDCEKLRQAIPASAMPVMNITHCVDFRVEDVRAKPGPAGAASREEQKTGGGSAGGGQ